MASGRQFLPPPFWDDESLEKRRRQAIDVFIEERAAEGNKPYEDAFQRSLAGVEELFLETNDLRDFSAGRALTSKPALTRIARYLAGPPVSADDLSTLAGMSVGARGRLTAAVLAGVFKLKNLKDAQGTAGSRYSGPAR